MKIFTAFLYFVITSLFGIIVPPIIGDNVLLFFVGCNINFIFVTTVSIVLEKCKSPSYIKPLKIGPKTLSTALAILLTCTCLGGCIWNCYVKLVFSAIRPIWVFYFIYSNTSYIFVRYLILFIELLFLFSVVMLEFLLPLHKVLLSTIMFFITIGAIITTSTFFEHRDSTFMLKKQDHVI